MAKYDEGDLATYYFVVNDDGNNKQIQGWTDNKALARYYMEFHNCKRFRLTSLTKPIEEIAKILEENNNDEIQIRNVLVRNPKGKKGKNAKYIQIPVTGTESAFINEESAMFLASTQNYSYLDSAIPYLKKKYRDAIEAVFLSDVIKKVIHNQNPRSITEIELDQLSVLLKLFPDNFGK